MVHSAHQCLQTLKRNPVDLVLLDLLMPETDGLATLRENQGKSYFRKYPRCGLDGVDDVRPRWPRRSVWRAKSVSSSECFADCCCGAFEHTWKSTVDKHGCLRAARPLGTLERSPSAAASAPSLAPAIAPAHCATPSCQAGSSICTS